MPYALNTAWRSSNNDTAVGIKSKPKMQAAAQTCKFAIQREAALANVGAPRFEGCFHFSPATFGACSPPGPPQVLAGQGKRADPLDDRPRRARTVLWLNGGARPGVCS